jgi:hypothetical protein
MIDAEHTRLFIKLLLFIVASYSLLAILFGKPGSTVSEVMGQWGKEEPFIPVAWVAGMNVLAFHWWKW